MQADYSDLPPLWKVVWNYLYPYACTRLTNGRICKYNVM